MFKERLDYVRKGLIAFRENNAIEAVKNYTTYLKIMEEVKQIPRGKLTLAQFDVKKDQAEIVMISSIYWDLLRLYDRAPGKAVPPEFLEYARKYVEFTKGCAHESLAVNTVRKYIRSKATPHRAVFKKIFADLGGKNLNCFVATELSREVGPEALQALRRFRDTRLQHSALGREFMLWYDENGPRLARRVSFWPQWMRWVLASGIRVFASCVG